MITSTAYAPSNIEIDSQSQLCREKGDTDGDGQLVSARLRGQWADIVAVMEHWGIEIDWRSRRAIGRVNGECVVDGKFRARKH